MPEATLAGRDVFARHTDTNGASHVQSHRVWDADRFFGARQTEAASANAQAIKKGEPALAKVEQITEQQYRDQRKR